MIYCSIQEKKVLQVVPVGPVAPISVDEGGGRPVPPFVGNKLFGRDERNENPVIPEGLGRFGRLGVSILKSHKI